MTRWTSQDRATLILIVAGTVGLSALGAAAGIHPFPIAACCVIFSLGWLLGHESRDG